MKIQVKYTKPRKLSLLLHPMSQRASWDILNEHSICSSLLHWRNYKPRDTEGKTRWMLFTIFIKILLSSTDLLFFISQCASRARVEITWHQRRTHWGFPWPCGKTGVRLWVQGALRTSLAQEVSPVPSLRVSVAGVGGRAAHTPGSGHESGHCERSGWCVCYERCAR